MKKSAFLVSVLTLGIAVLVMFQNCGKLEVKKPQSSITGSGGGGGGGGGGGTIDPPIEPPPVVIAKRDFALDNPLMSGETLANGYNLAAGDVVHYETNYKAVTQSTYARIYYNGMVNVFAVTSDDPACVGERTIANAELQTFVDSFNALMFLDRQSLGATDVLTENCDIPRFAMSAQDANLKDVMIYLVERSCVPFNQFYATSQAVEMNAFFQAQIDAVCAMP